MREGLEQRLETEAWVLVLFPRQSNNVTQQKCCRSVDSHKTPFNIGKIIYSCNSVRHFIFAYCYSPIEDIDGSNKTS